MKKGLMKRAKKSATAPDRKSAASLIERCNQGDREAWNQFYARYMGVIARAVSRYSQSAVETTDDLVQEVFIQLFKALKSYDSSRPVEAYILEISKRVGVSRFRRISAAKRGGLDTVNFRISAHGEGEAGYIVLGSPDEDQESALIKANATRSVRAALRSLKEACRKLLSLRYEKGLSYGEIAELLEVKEGTLRVRVQRCLSTLAQRYSGLAPEEVG